jgi:hypothetical protein
MADSVTPDDINEVGLATTRVDFTVSNQKARDEQGRDEDFRMRSTCKARPYAGRSRIPAPFIAHYSIARSRGGLTLTYVKV